MPKTRVLTALAALALSAGAMPASAQSTVTVTLDTTASSRTLHVENMAGQPLSSLDFGSVRSLPFRVRVVDSSFTRTPFTVSATMSNLYLDNAGTPVYGTRIASSNVAVGSQANPLNILGVSAAVQPLVNTVSTVTDSTICSTLGVAMTLVGSTNACVLNASSLTGNVQNLGVNVDLNNLTNLPLLPQANETGSFTNADYSTGAGAGDTAGKTAAAGITPTPRRLVAGAPAVTSTVLNALTDALVKTPLSTLVPTASVTSALQSQFATTWALLTSGQIDAILASTAGTPLPVTASQVLSQTGTYMSLPTLAVTVPGGVPAGQYKGTLVVTALQ